MIFGTRNSSSAKYTPYLYDKIITYIKSLTIQSSLAASKDNVMIPTESDYSDPDYSTSDNEFFVFYGGSNETSEWTITVDSSTDCTVTITSNVVTVTDITENSASYVVRADRTDYSTLTKTVQVARMARGADGIDGTDGTDGLGWTSASYNSNSGIVTFLSDDGLGFATEDLRGADGEGSATDAGTTQDATTNAITPTTDDSAVAGGTRGYNAIDLSLDRLLSTQVASGDLSFNSGFANTPSGAQSACLGGSLNTPSGTSSVSLGGLGNDPSGDLAAATGRENSAPSYGEFCCGVYGTDYTPAASGSIDSSDRVFNVGIGTSGGNDDAFSIFKDGSIFIYNIKSGTTQVDSGASVNEMWLNTASGELKLGI